MKWTDEEKARIVRMVTSKGFTEEEVQVLQPALPGRSATQIKDQYRQILKPQLLGLFQSSTLSSPTSSAATTPSNTPKKRSRKMKEDSEE